MNRFEFSLETVLKLRENQEQEWENKLAVITGECVKMRQNIEHYEEEKSRCALENQYRDINSLMAVANYQMRMDSQIKSTEKQLVLKQKERESVLKDFIEASKKRKILDKLKEKKLDEYHHLLSKDEAKKTDDVNNAKWAGISR